MSICENLLGTGWLEQSWASAPAAQSNRIINNFISEVLTSFSGECLFNRVLVSAAIVMILFGCDCRFYSSMLSPAGMIYAISWFYETIGSRSYFYQTISDESFSSTSFWVYLEKAKTIFFFSLGLYGFVEKVGWKSFLELSADRKRHLIGRHLSVNVRWLDTEIQIEYEHQLQI